MVAGPDRPGVSEAGSTRANSQPAVPRPYAQRFDLANRKRRAVRNPVLPSAPHEGMEIRALLSKSPAPQGAQ